MIKHNSLILNACQKDLHTKLTWKRNVTNELEKTFTVLIDKK